MPTKDVILFNRDRFQPFEATLYHSIVCSKLGHCICGAEERPGAGGAPEAVRLEKSFWIGPRESSQPLPIEVLEVPQVKRALALQKLQLLGQLAQVQVFPGAGR